MSLRLAEALRRGLEKAAETNFSFRRDSVRRRHGHLAQDRSRLGLHDRRRARGPHGFHLVGHRPHARAEPIAPRLSTRNFPPLAIYNLLGLTLAWWIRRPMFHADSGSTSFQLFGLGILTHFT